MPISDIILSQPIPLVELPDKFIQRLQKLLQTYTITASKNLKEIHAITLHFKDEHYSPENGGFHPVEIRCRQSSQRNHFYIEYITDFCFVGNDYPELIKAFDIDWGEKTLFLYPFGWAMPHEIADYLNLWVSNFLHYWDSDVYQITFSTE